MTQYIGKSSELCELSNAKGALQTYTRSKFHAVCHEEPDPQHASEITRSRREREEVEGTDRSSEADKEKKKKDEREKETERRWRTMRKERKHRTTQERSETKR